MNRDEIWRLEGERNCALGRVIARIELYDEATSIDQPRQLNELLSRCRELASAHNAVLVAQGIAPSPSASGDSNA